MAAVGTVTVISQGSLRKVADYCWGQKKRRSYNQGITRQWERGGNRGKAARLLITEKKPNPSSCPKHL